MIPKAAIVSGSQWLFALVLGFCAVAGMFRDKSERAMLAEWQRVKLPDVIEVAERCSCSPKCACCPCPKIH